jgi:hypothetical protein
MKITDVTYYVARGIFYGYSQESIQNFILRGYCVENQLVIDIPSPTGTLFEGMGWIPSEKELGLDPQEVIRLINFRRIYSVPFGEHAEDLDPEDIEFGKYTMVLMKPGLSRSLVQNMAAAIILQMATRGYALEDA